LGGGLHEEHVVWVGLSGLVSEERNEQRL